MRLTLWTTCIPTAFQSSCPHMHPLEQCCQQARACPRSAPLLEKLTSPHFAQKYLPAQTGKHRRDSMTHDVRDPTQSIPCRYVPQNQIKILVDCCSFTDASHSGCSDVWLARALTHLLRSPRRVGFDQFGQQRRRLFGGRRGWTHHGRSCRSCSGSPPWPASRCWCWATRTTCPPPCPPPSSSTAWSSRRFPPPPPPPPPGGGATAPAAAVTRPTLSAVAPYGTRVGRTDTCTWLGSQWFPCAS